MDSQGLGRVELARQLGLAERRVDLVVADLVQQHGCPLRSTFELRGEVVGRLPGVAWDGPAAKRAVRKVPFFFVVGADGRRGATAAVVGRDRRRTFIAASSQSPARASGRSQAAPRGLPQLKASCPPGHEREEP